ncbi:MAG: NAD(+)/NADH kinase [Bacteroidales bacterium]
MIHRVGIVAKSGLLAAAAYLLEIAGWLRARGIEPIFDAESAALAGAGPEWRALPKDELPKATDLILVLAGDGTLLGMADRIAEAGREVPILGVNFGALGFLTEITLAELYPALEATLDGRATIERRLMLRASVRRAGQVIAERLLLNDVVITRGPLSRIIDLSVSVGGHFVARFTADGLIVATPTGSTAYNLSAGGPIVHPGLNALVLTPIAPHILTNRPVVIPASEEVQVQPLARDGGDEIYVTFDGQTGLRLQADDQLSIHPATRAMLLVHASTRTYFEVLRRKLKWAER